jgi:ABC-2 type transport system permease protein
MFQQTFAIIRNTFFESIRQPIMLVMLVIATLLIILANLLSGYTMSDDQKMFVDMGMATVFICGAVLAAFIATNVLGREIENRTVLTVVSKPVSRPLFVLGKYLGVAGALALATLFMCLVFLLVEQHSVLQTVREPVHLPVIVFGLGAAAIGLAVGIWCNYFYNKVFASTAVCVTTPLLVLAYVLSLMFGADFTPKPIADSIEPQLWLALFSLLVAVMVLTSVALAASTRLGQVLTLCITVAIFLAGLLSDWFIGRRLAAIDQTWNQRVVEADDRALQSLIDERTLETVRLWVKSVYDSRTNHILALGQCRTNAELFQHRNDAPDVSAAERQQYFDSLRAYWNEQANVRFEAARKDAQEAVDRVRWPISKDSLVLEFDWPLIVHRTANECETISNRKTFIYPSLPAMMATGSERWAYVGYRIAYSIVPNFQVMWLSDALTQGHLIPAKHVVRTSIYGVLYIMASLSLAVFLFQRREVG